MRKNKFNYFVNEGEKIICCNTISGKIFSVNTEEYSMIQDVLNNPVSEMKDLRDWMIDNKFLVDENANEVDMLRLINREHVFENTYHLMINPTLECNFSCWYCYQNHSEGHMNEKTIENIKKYVNNLVLNNKIKGIRLSWFGGEPLLYYDEVVYPISLYIKELMEQHSLPYNNAMTTNGSLINEHIIKKNYDIKLFKFQITLDGDRESHNQTRNHKGKPSFDTIISNIINMCSYDDRFCILLRINYTDEIIQKKYEKILEIIPAGIRSQITINFQRVWQTRNNVSKNEDNHYLINSIESLRKMGFKIAISSYKLKRNTVCYADRFYYAHINFDGKVYKCTARNYEPDDQVGELLESGQIKWKSGELERRYLKAQFENSQCLNCKNLSICGGPCSQRKLDYENKLAKRLCVNHVHEIGIDTFIRQEYHNVKAYYSSLK